MVQTTVTTELTSFVVGERAFCGPERVQTALLATPTETNNLPSRACTWLDKEAGTVQVGGDLDTYTFAGFLVNTRGLQRIADFGDSDVIANGQQVELMLMGEYAIELATTGGTIGDGLFFNDTTGAVDFGTASTGESQIVGAAISRMNASSDTPSLACVYANVTA